MHIQFKTRCGIALSFVILIYSSAGDMPVNSHDTMRERVESLTRDLAASIDHERVLVADGLVADRDAQTVILFARATGLPVGSTVEFILVGPHSDRDYEAAAMTFAQASDLCRAIEFLGVPRGEPAFSRPLAFWPKGERLLGSFRDLDSPDPVERPLEALVFDRRRAQALPARGLIYCGSRWEGDPLRCAADGVSPGAILSTYNEPTTVLDLPHQAPQSDVYERFTVNPDTRSEMDALLQITLRPEPRPDQRPRVENYTLRFLPDADDEDPGGSARLRADVIRHDENVLINATLLETFRFFQERVESDFDPYVGVIFDDRLTLNQAHAAAQALDRVEGPNGLRVDAPPSGPLYYKAFMPDAQWRRREDRFAQPWELHLIRPAADNGYALRLVQIIEHWPPGEMLNPELEVREYDLAAAGDLPETLASLPKGLPVILVFAPGAARLEHMTPALRAVMDTHPTIYVFNTDDGAPTEP